MKNPPGFAIAPEDAQECWIPIEGAQMRYLRRGSGPAIVLLHGLLGYSFSWRFAIPQLARQATVFAPDMLGAGFSGRPAEMDCSLRANAERILHFLDEVGVETADLLGTSYGGAVVMMAAALQPQRVRCLILVAPVNPWSARGRRLAPFLSCGPVAGLFLVLAPLLEIAHSVLLRRLYGDTRRIPPGTLEGYAAPFAIPGSFGYAINLLKTWNSDLHQLESMLPRLSEIPTLLLWGSEDRAVNPASALILRQQLPHSRLIVFDGVGHLPYEEAPELFNRAVSDFLMSAGAPY